MKYITVLIGVSDGTDISELHLQIIDFISDRPHIKVFEVHQGDLISYHSGYDDNVKNF